MISRETKDACFSHGLNISEHAIIKKGIKLHFEAPVMILRALTIGNEARVGAYTYLRTGTISSLSSIGRYCSFGPNISIGEANHPIDWLSTSSFQYNNRFSWYKPYEKFVQRPMTQEDRVIVNKKPPLIGNDVWVGANAQILRGVVVGNGAIIAAGAVVHRNVEPYEIVGGVPIKHIRYRFPEEIRSMLLETSWWSYIAPDLSGIDFRNVLKAIEEIRRRRDANEIVPKSPEWKTYHDGKIICN